MKAELVITVEFDFQIRRNRPMKNLGRFSFKTSDESQQKDSQMPLPNLREGMSTHGGYSPQSIQKTVHCSPNQRCYNPKLCQTCNGIRASKRRKAFMQKYQQVETEGDRLKLKYRRTHLILKTISVVLNKPRHVTKREIKNRIKFAKTELGKPSKNVKQLFQEITGLLRHPGTMPRGTIDSLLKDIRNEIGHEGFSWQFLTLSIAPEFDSLTTIDQLNYQFRKLWHSYLRAKGTGAFKTIEFGSNGNPHAHILYFGPKQDLCSYTHKWKGYAHIEDAYDVDSLLNYMLKFDRKLDLETRIDLDFLTIGKFLTQTYGAFRS